MSEKMLLIGYMRVSSNGQIDGDGFHRQSEAIKEFVRVNFPDAILELAREEGVSGATEVDQRPMFAALLESWDSGASTKPYAVIVENLDRFSRKLMVQECAIKDLSERGIKVFACNHGTMDFSDATSDPTRALIRQVFGAIAEYAKAVTVLRCSLARKRIRQAKGKCEGRKYFGENDPHDRKVMNRVLSLFDCGLRSRRIAKVLSAQGVVLASGRPLNDRLVRRIIARHRKVDPNPTLAE